MALGTILYIHGHIHIYNFHILPRPRPTGARTSPSPRPPARSCSAPGSLWSPSPHLRACAGHPPARAPRQTRARWPRWRWAGSRTSAPGGPAARPPYISIAFEDNAWQRVRDLSQKHHDHSIFSCHWPLPQWALSLFCPPLALRRHDVSLLPHQSPVLQLLALSLQPLAPITSVASSSASTRVRAPAHRAPRTAHATAQRVPRPAVNMPSIFW